MVNDKSIDTIGDVPIFGFMMLGILLVSFCTVVWTPPWDILISRFRDLELLGIPLLMDAGSRATGCVSL
jgi:hypothetical protein